MRGQAKAGRTHSIEALDVADVLVDEEKRVVGHGRGGSTPGPRNKRHVRDGGGVVVGGREGGI